jgi:RNA polymerase sigma-70 factor (ECF subfamily)
MSDIQNEMLALLPAMRAFSRGFCPKQDEADDLVQETLRRAIGGVHTFTPETNLRSWMFTIMRNAFYTSVRKRNREMTGLDHDVAADDIATSPNQEWTLRAKEVERAVYSLPAEFREVVVLICVSGLSYDEAAKVCKCPQGTIKSRLNRARALLIRELG